MNERRIAGREAAGKKGWLRANQWLLLRRLSQAAILGLFLLGPLAGIWVISGTLSASTVFGFLPLTDPLTLAQSLAAGHLPAAAALIGAAVVIAVYALIGGRVFCAWVCPVNPLTDAAAWLNRRLEIKHGLNLSRKTRYWLLALLIVMAAATGSIISEWFNPVTIIQRGLIFGMGFGWMLAVALFFFEAFVLRHGWCGHLCPMGAAYSLLGRFALLRVKAARREHCTDCMDCFAVCPEPQVIRPALKGGTQSSALISASNCLNCGRCLDICPQEVFSFAKRS